MADKVRVTPSATAPHYAPAYVAEDLGIFTDESLVVDATIESGPGSSWLADNLMDGKADIALGGIWIPLMYRNRLENFCIFAQVCDRNPKVLIARAPMNPFAWSLMYEKKVLLPMSATSQWMFLHGALEEAGIDIGRIQFLRDLDVATMTRAWRGGIGDFYLVSPPLSEKLEAEGFVVVASMAAMAGRVPWSVYYATETFVAENRSIVERFSRAMQRSLDWIMANRSDTVAGLIGHRFPGVSMGTFTAAIDRHRIGGVWARTIDVPIESFMRYQVMIARYGLIGAPYPFEEVVGTPLRDPHDLPPGRERSRVQRAI